MCGLSKLNKDLRLDLPGCPLLNMTSDDNVWLNSKNHITFIIFKDVLSIKMCMVINSYWNDIILYLKNKTFHPFHTIVQIPFYHRVAVVNKITDFLLFIGIAMVTTGVVVLSFFYFTFSAEYSLTAFVVSEFLPIPNVRYYWIIILVSGCSQSHVDRALSISSILGGSGSPTRRTFPYQWFAMFS